MQRTLFAAILFSLTHNYAAAGLISIDDANFGAGALTRDTVSGLDWLDLTLSINRTFIDVSSQFGPSGDFDGFRYATNAEIADFWTAAGIPDIGSMTAANIAPAQNLMDLIGSTSFQVGIGDGREALAIGANAFRSDLDGVIFGGPTIKAVVADFQSGNAATTVGHWLVRENAAAAVPEPSSLALLIIGGVSCLLVNRRRK